MTAADDATRLAGIDAWLNRSRVNEGTSDVAFLERLLAERQQAIDALVIGHQNVTQEAEMLRSALAESEERQQPGRKEVMQHTERPEQPIRQETLGPCHDNTSPPSVVEGGDPDADWLAWVRLNPGTDTRRLLSLLDAAQSALVESQAEIDRLHDLLQQGEDDLHVTDQKLYAAREELAESDAEVARLKTQISQEQDNADALVTDARLRSTPAIQLPSLTDEQRAYLRDLNRKARNYDPETIILGQKYEALEEEFAESEASRRAPLGDAKRCQWTLTELDELKDELCRRHLLDPLEVRCADAIGSVQFDLVDAKSALAESQAEVARLKEELKEWISEIPTFCRQDKSHICATILACHDECKRLARLRSPAATGEEIERAVKDFAGEHWGGFRGPIHCQQAAEGLADKVAAAARAQGERDGIERAAHAVRHLDTPDTLTNEWAFGWEHCRDKAVLMIRALAPAP